MRMDKNELNYSLLALDEINEIKLENEITKQFSTINEKMFKTKINLTGEMKADSLIFEAVKNDFVDIKLNIVTTTENYNFKVELNEICVFDEFLNGNATISLKLKCLTENTINISYLSETSDNLSISVVMFGKIKTGNSLINNYIIQNSSNYNGLIYKGGKYFLTSGNQGQIFDVENHSLNVEFERVVDFNSQLTGTLLSIANSNGVVLYKDVYNQLVFSNMNKSKSVIVTQNNVDGACIIPILHNTYAYQVLYLINGKIYCNFFNSNFAIIGSKEITTNCNNRIKKIYSFQIYNTSKYYNIFIFQDVFDKCYIISCDNFNENTTNISYNNFVFIGKLEGNLRGVIKADKLYIIAQSESVTIFKFDYLSSSKLKKVSKIQTLNFNNVTEGYFLDNLIVYNDFYTIVPN